ncbi:MAG: ribonuclease III [Patescibacteria group bacterium]|nr:ribonuclease III [Patescibacteria group bacterium]
MSAIQLPKFKNKQLLEQSFVHRSYLNETKKKLSSNERLEFLGDSVISFVVSQYLFNKYPAFDEGVLTNLRSLLVNTKSLAQVAKELNFGSLLLLSKGEEESKGRQNQSLLADSFEAFTGALFLDQGIDVVSDFLSKVLLPKADIYVKNKSFKDPKSLLQEKVQSKKQNSPVYKVILEQGPAHAKIFTVGAFIDNVLTGKGEGKSKQEAEESAAKQALANLKNGVENKPK